MGEAARLATAHECAAAGTMAGQPARATEELCVPSEELGELEFAFQSAVCRRLTMALIVQQTSPPAAVEQQDAEGVLQLTGSITSVSKAVTGVGPCQLSGRICDCSECL